MKVRETVWRGERGEGTIFYRLDRNGKRISPNLYVSYRAAGSEHVKSALTADLGEAKHELARLTRNRANAAEGLDVLRTPKVERLTVEQLVESYLVERGKECESIAAMRSHAKPLLAALGRVKAVELTPDHVRRYKALRASPPPPSRSVSPAKISRELEILKAAYNVAAEEGRLRSVPVIKLPSVKNKRKVFFPLERVPELLARAAKVSSEVSDFLAWLSFSGMRPKAIRLLRWSDLDVADWVLTLRSEEDKNEYGRELAIEGEAREILDRRRAQRRPGDVFIFGGVKPLTNKTVWTLWNATLEAMELPTGKAGFRPYDLKKTALRALRRAGVSEERAMFFSGHRTSSTFRRYDITARDDNREDVVRVSEYRKRRFADKDGENADKSSKLLRIS
jgi:integrase